MTIKSAGISQAAVQALIDTAIADVDQFKIPLPHTFFNDWFDQTILNDSYFSGTGSADFIQTEYRQQTGATAGSNSTSYKVLNSSSATLSWNKKRHIRYDINAISPTNNVVLNYYTSGSKLTDWHVGFEISGGKLKASAGDGVAQTTVDIESLAAGGFNKTWRLEIIFTPAVKAEYYVNRILKATITTNLPAGADFAAQFFYFTTRNSTSAENKTTKYGKCFFMQED